MYVNIRLDVASIPCMRLNNLYKLLRLVAAVYVLYVFVVSDPFFGLHLLSSLLACSVLYT